MAPAQKPLDPGGTILESAMGGTVAPDTEPITQIARRPFPAEVEPGAGASPAQADHAPEITLAQGGLAPEPFQPPAILKITTLASTGIGPIPVEVVAGLQDKTKFLPVNQEEGGRQRDGIGRKQEKENEREAGTEPETNPTVDHAQLAAQRVKKGKNQTRRGVSSQVELGQPGAKPTYETDGPSGTGTGVLGPEPKAITPAAEASQEQNPDKGGNGQQQEREGKK